MLHAHIFDHPSLCLQNSFQQLTSKLKKPIDVPHGDSRCKISSVAREAVSYSEADAQKAFFTINVYRQNILWPSNPCDLGDCCSTGIPVRKHHDKRRGRFSYHAYDDALPEVQRLAKATWQNNAELHEVDTRFLCSSISPAAIRTVRDKLSRWAPHVPLHPGDNNRWARLWNATQGIKESCFLWQVLYNMNATQMWRLFRLLPSDPTRHCKLCDLAVDEDNCHLFWDCPFIAKFWQWAASFLWLRASTTWSLQLQLACIAR